MLKNILIIGANSDIAHALMLALAKQFKPEQFLLATHHAATLQPVAQDIFLRTQIPCQQFVLNVEDTRACSQFYTQLNCIPDCVIYTAGYLGDQAKAEIDYIEAEKILAINYTGAMILLEAAAQNMHKGVIIAISSVAGLRGRQSNYYYGAAKAALTTFLSGLRNRLAQNQPEIQVITLLPGPVYTKMTAHLPLAKLLTATTEQVAKATVNAILKSKTIVYVKPIWRVIMAIICFLPEFIFKKTRL